MKRNITFLLFLVQVLIATADGPRKIDLPGYVNATKDKAAVEEEIYMYMRYAHHKTGEKIYSKDKKDLSLKYLIKISGAPPSIFTIDTITVDLEKNILQYIFLMTKCKIPQELANKESRKKLLAFNSEWMLQKYAYPQCIILTKNNIISKSSISISSWNSSLSLGSFYSLLMLSAKGWADYQIEFHKKFNIKLNSIKAESIKPTT
jgi:hypothetical protein